MAAHSTSPRQNVLVTGASAGIGREIASVFAGRGFDLVLVARRRVELEAVAAGLRTTGAHVCVLPMDLTDRTAPTRLLDAVRQRGLEVDVLVNNAGVTAYGDFVDLPLDRQLQMIQLNAVALTAITHLFVRPMIARGRGHMLNVASMTAFQPVPALAVYAATKAFVVSFSEALAVELRGTGVTVTACCPGFTDTDMVRTPSASSGRSAALPSLLVGDAADVARDACDACLRGTPLQVSGTINQAATYWMQHQPRWLGRALGGWVRGWGR